MIAQTTLEVFETEIRLVTKQREYRREIRQLAEEDEERPEWSSVGLCQEFHSGDGSDGQRPRYLVLVCLDERVRTGDPRHYQKAVIHEAVHAGAMILDHLGHHYSGDDEPLAYLVAYLAMWLSEQVP